MILIRLIPQLKNAFKIKGLGSLRFFLDIEVIKSDMQASTRVFRYIKLSLSMFVALFWSLL